MPTETLIESADKSRIERSWADIIFAPAMAGIAIYNYWRQYNPFICSETKLPDTPWSQANTLQLAYAVGMRHYLTLHGKQIARSTKSKFDLPTLFSKHHVGVNPSPASLKTIQPWLEIIDQHGCVVFPIPRTGQIEHAFGPLIDLSDLTWDCAFQGTADARKNCTRINFEHCQFNSHKRSNAPMQYADLRDTNLRHANLQRCDLSGSDFCGADLRDTDLRNTVLDGVLYDYRTLFNRHTKLPPSFHAHLVTRFDEKTGDLFGYKFQNGFHIESGNPLYPQIAPALLPASVITLKEGEEYKRPTHVKVTSTSKHV